MGKKIDMDKKSRLGKDEEIRQIWQEMKAEEVRRRWYDPKTGEDLRLQHGKVWKIWRWLGLWDWVYIAFWVSFGAVMAGFWLVILRRAF